MNMYLHEVKSYMKSTFIWTTALVLMAAFFMSLYPAFSTNSEGIRKYFESMPQALTKGMGIDIKSITSLVGFYSFIFVFISLCGAIQAMHLGTAIVSKEVREKTADFLLTKPVSRVRIMTAKLIAVFTSLLFTNAVYLAVSSIIALAAGKNGFSKTSFFLISLSLFFIQLIFAALGLIISVAAKKIRSVLSIALGTVFGFYFISAFGSVINEDAVKYITPFKYFDTSYIMKNSSYDTLFLVIGAILVAAFVSAGYYIYTRKDIHAV